MGAQGVSKAVSTNSTITAHHGDVQPFCHNWEGWGPISLQFYDFTPCFRDVPVAVVSVFGIITGSITLWLLLKGKSKQPTPKDWHYYTKLVRL